MGEPALDDCVQFAAEVAMEAGAILRAHFGQPHDVHFKGAIDIVTEADKASEALIVYRLQERFPEIDLIGEEGSRGAIGDTRFRWVIDPLDGTTNFSHDLPTFAVSIGLEDRGLPVGGAIYDPMRDELFVALKGGGAFLNGSPLHVSAISELIGSLLVTGFSYDFAIRVRQADVWRDFLTQVQAIRQTGSAALNLCYIAAGRLDGYWEQGISAWDVAAGAVMVMEAGGKVTDMRGGVFRADDRQLVASNGALHDHLLAVIAPHLDESARTVAAGT
jgi:myo-inositol-1(or 4)-monophosphatase